MGEKAESPSETVVINKQMAKDTERGHVMNRNFRSHNFQDSYKSQWPPLVFGGTVVLALVIALALLLMGREEMNSIKVRLDQLERKSARLEVLEEKVYRLNRVIITTKSELEDSMEKLKKWRFLLDQRLAEQIQRYYELGRRQALAPKESKARPYVNKNSMPEIGDRYHEVRSGETLYGIAKKHGISVEKLCRLNGISRNKSIQPGQKLLAASRDSR